MAILNPIGVDQTTGQSRSLKAGDTLEVAGLPVPQVLSQTTGVNLDTVSTDPLYTVPSGQSAVIIAVVVRLTTATSANGDAVVSVGTNASAFDDIISAQTLTGLDVTTKSYTIEVGGITHIAAAAEVITFQIDTADTGGTVTATVDLIGYLI